VLLALADGLALQEVDFGFLGLILEVMVLELLLEICQSLLHAPGLVLFYAGNLELYPSADVALREDCRLGITKVLEWPTGSVELDGERAS
jgi:hypothetical protein